MEWQQAHSLTKQKHLKSHDFGFGVKIGKVYLSRLDKKTGRLYKKLKILQLLNI